ncbi:MAG: universal stress protein [Candidatus Thorarchaeota archaeon]
MYNKILVGIDDSSESIDAVKRAIDIGKEYNSKVIIFHSIFHHLTEISTGFSLTPSSNILMSILPRDDYIYLGKKLLKKVKNLFKEHNLIVETRLISDMTPEDYIKKVTSEEYFDLVILGFRGKHSRLRRAILTPVPDKIINTADCDVLIVR